MTGAAPVLDRFKFERTATSSCRAIIIEEVVHLWAFWLLLLRCRVITLVSGHFRVLCPCNAGLLFRLIGGSTVRAHLIL